LGAGEGHIEQTHVFVGGRGRFVGAVGVIGVSMGRRRSIFFNRKTAPKGHKHQRVLQALALVVRDDLHALRIGF
jgi:hypothetical protein